MLPVHFCLKAIETSSVRASSWPSSRRSSICPRGSAPVLILRDVLGFSAHETAEALETTPASVDSALQRAHKTVDERLPEQSQQATLRFIGDAAHRRGALAPGFPPA
jgi:hypothetical protein